MKEIQSEHKLSRALGSGLQTRGQEFKAKMVKQHLAVMLHTNGIGSVHALKSALFAHTFE